MDRKGKPKLRLSKEDLKGIFKEIKGEFARKVLDSQYRINPTDGQGSREFISHLDITKLQPTFDATIAGYVGTDGAFKLSENINSAGSVTEIKNLYETHKPNIRA
jgi:hypothetical protein